MLAAVGKNIILKEIVEEPVSSGGIVLPNAPKSGVQRGSVVAIGSGVDSNIDTTNKVIIRRGMGIQVQDRGNDYLIVKEDDILAKIL